MEIDHYDVLEGMQTSYKFINDETQLIAHMPYVQFISIFTIFIYIDFNKSKYFIQLKVLNLFAFQTIRHN